MYWCKVYLALRNKIWCLLLDICNTLSILWCVFTQTCCVSRGSPGPEIDPFWYVGRGVRPIGRFGKRNSRVGSGEGLRPVVNTLEMLLDAIRNKEDLGKVLHEDSDWLPWQCAQFSPLLVSVKVFFLFNQGLLLYFSVSGLILWQESHWSLCWPDHWTLWPDKKTKQDEVYTYEKCKLYWLINEDIGTIFSPSFAIFLVSVRRYSG